MEEMNELFYRDPYCREFDARVISCTEGKNGFEVVLEDTAFYPEGGGQPADHGRLGDAEVRDVRKKDGVIIHYVDQALETGRTVHGVIDWARRFDHMQQHTGEHMLSGLIHQTYGYENVGFHLGPETILIDLDGTLTWEQVLDLEQRANEAIWKDMPLAVSFPDAEALSHLEYRSKKELSGVVRIVKIPECDVCACCGTHVSRTGEVGMIKCLSVEKHKEGSRITLVCGGRALRDYNVQLSQNTEISHLLSARPFETAAAVKALQASETEKGRRSHALALRYLDMKADSLAPVDLLIDYEEGARPDDLREFGNRLLDAGKAGICALYTDGTEPGSYTYVLLSRTTDLRAAGKALNARLNGRGGGRGDLIQGGWQADRPAIEAALKETFSH